MDTIDRIFELVDVKFKEQKEFAAAVGVSEDTASDWRRKKSESCTKGRHLKKIAEILETTTEYLLTGKSPSLSVIPASCRELQALADALAQLNEEGREKLLDYAADLVASGRYKKDGPARLGQEA